MSTLRTWNPLGVLASTLLEYSLGVLWDPFRDHLGSILGSILAPDGLKGPRGTLDHRAFKSYVLVQ